MDPEQLFRELRARVIDRPVSRRRLAANSLLVYVDAQLGDQAGVTLWFEPSWHLRGPTSVLTGSRQAANDPHAQEADAEFELAARALDVLNGRRVTDLSIEPVTGDLFLSLEGSYLVRTFVSDPLDDELWHIRDNATGRRLKRSAQRLTIESVDA